LLGENLEQEVLTEQIKFLIASLPLLIEKMKADSYCFVKPLTLAELRIDEFGQFVIAQGITLEKVTRDGLSRTYKSSAGLIREIIGDPVPQDIEHLISKMKMRKTPAYLILVHPSLIPLPSHSLAYLDAHDILCANISKKDIAPLLNCLRDSLKQWDHTVTSNKLLKYFFWQAVKSTERLFSDLRNLECHMLGHQKTLGMYTKNQVRILTLCKFPKVLPFLYWLLSGKRGCLPNWKLKISFACLDNHVLHKLYWECACSPPRGCTCYHWPCCACHVTWCSATRARPQASPVISSSSTF
jgi:hypothetical protein